MRLTRREALAITGAGVLATGCGRLADRTEKSPESLYSATDLRQEEIRFLDRATYGATPDEVAKLRSLGKEAWIEEQLSAPEDDPASVSMKYKGMPIFYLTPFDLRDWPIEDVMRQLEAQAIIRAVHSPHQLRERLVDFWSNHFSIYSNKGMGAFRKPKDERDVIRRHVFGKFGDMLAASASSTAMLVYLDQQNSTWVQPNENYARELLELHTMGVDGGYTQADVVAVARCFTGWTEERGFLKRKGEFKFDERLHDNGEKVVLGKKILSKGVDQGFEVVRMLSSHPATAKYVSGKLTRHFVGEGNSALEHRVEQVFLETGGDIRAMVREILMSEAIIEPGRAFKRPFDFLVGSIRTIGGRVISTDQLHAHLQVMGQPLHNWPAPDGYPTDSQAWSSSVIGRWNFALALARGEIQGVEVDWQKIPDSVPTGSANELYAELLGTAPTEAHAERLRTTLSHVSKNGRVAREDLLAIALCDPVYQWR